MILILIKECASKFRESIALRNRVVHCTAAVGRDQFCSQVFRKFRCSTFMAGVLPPVTEVTESSAEEMEVAEPEALPLWHHTCCFSSIVAWSLFLACRFRVIVMIGGDGRATWDCKQETSCSFGQSKSESCKIESCSEKDRWQADGWWTERGWWRERGG